MRHKSGSDKVVKLGLRHTRPRSNIYGTCVPFGTLWESRLRHRCNMGRFSETLSDIYIYLQVYIYIVGIGNNDGKTRESFNTSTIARELLSLRTWDTFSPLE